MIGTETICAGSRSSPTPSALTIHEIDPTVKIWPGYGRDEEPAKCTIVDRISSTVLQGVSHEGRLIDSGARNQEQEGNRDTRVRQV